MKAGQEHRIPLSAPALTVLEKAEKQRTAGDLVFQGRKKDTPLSNMAMLMLTRRMGFTDERGQPMTASTAWAVATIPFAKIVESEARRFNQRLSAVITSPLAVWAGSCHICRRPIRF